MLALWREWGVDIILRKDYDSGVLLALTIGAYFLYLVSGLTQRLWAQKAWFSENDVLLLAGCGPFESIPFSAAQTPKTWLKIQPFVELDWVQRV
jgi:hypothetical protein